MKPINLLLSLLLTVLGLQSVAQTPKLSVDVPANLKNFIPKDYDVLDLTRGDLNRDAYPDAIMVLYKKGEEKTSDVISHPEKRPLLLLIGQADKTYKLATQNDNAVYCVDCGGQMGDPFTGITIKNGYFSVEHYGGSGWRWTRIITFKYAAQEKNWFLYKDGGEHFHAISHEEVKTDVKTVKNFGKVPFVKFDIYKKN
ncbi:hypothetical protein [Pedobacter rhodius]|uniref:VCBS repeat-containing protein n=1 Tax=Pedobacter rhodius TaxID=3004098 RepID=A0ABT4L0V2_9SPHI|nr:hypothetical protein [Pedobacter sp. SJ11]MCZ4224824.1 hypothetical protein [Pedobacter sp. SJ11]